jgi:hypothetical protein
MTYKGGDKTISRLVEMLNKVGSTKLGGAALGSLTGSENNYNAYFGFPDATGEYVANGGSLGGDIALSSGAGWSDLGHEVWHAFQDENGSGGGSIFSEVEAYAAKASMEAESNGGIIPNLGRPGSYEAGFYSLAMQGLVGSHEFNQIAFDDAIKYFKLGSINNGKGAYDNFPLRLPYQRVLLKKLYPLVRRP